MLHTSRCVCAIELSILNVYVSFCRLDWQENGRYSSFESSDAAETKRNNVKRKRPGHVPFYSHKLPWQ